MRQTKKLLQELNCRCIRGELPREVKQVAYDSRNVEPGGLFVCIRGSRQDGHAFIREAVERGAVVILTEKGAWKEGNSSQEAAKQQKYYWKLRTRGLRWHLSPVNGLTIRRKN